MKKTKVIASVLSVLVLASAGYGQTVVMKGALRREVWGPNNTSVTRAKVEAGTAGQPSRDGVTLSSFETPVNEADNYVQRVSGVFIPPVTGRYTFFVCSDDDSDLFLNPTNDTPAGKILIAQETGWSNNRQWISANGGSADTKRSDLFDPTQFGSGIPLTAGKSYYIEGVHHEGGGGDDFSATYKIATDADPAAGDVTLLTGDVIGVSVTLPTAFGVKTQVTDTSAFVGTEASFTFVTTNNSSPNVGPSYQWYRNGQVLTNVTGQHYTILASSADDGAKYQCIARLAAPISQSVTSAIGTLTVKTGSVTAAGIKWENFSSNPSRTAIEIGNTAPASDLHVLPYFEIPIDRADNYGTRLSGYFLPPTTGKYVFFVASDDDSDLFLSTDDNPAHKRVIAQQVGWSGAHNWLTPGDTSNPLAANLKRSDQWTPDDGVTTPFAAGIDLTAGQKYYIEAVHHEGGGGDNLSATYIMKGDTDPADGTFTKLAVTNNNIQLITAPVTTLTIATQPKDVEVFAGQNAKFSVVANSDAEMLTYQWYKNGQIITNGTGANYAFQTVAGDNGSKLTVVIKPVVSSLVVTSAVANLTVKTPVFEPGYLLSEVWWGATRVPVENNTVGDPTDITTGTSFDFGALGDNYTRKISGMFVPPATDRYVFFLASDDDADLYLSTDDTVANMKQIAQEAGWAGGQRTWNTSGGGGSSTSQMRSDQWSPDGGATTPWSSGIPLTKGNKYYIEAVQHNGGGGNYVGVYAKKVNDADPANGDASTLTSTNIGFYAPAATYVAFTQQPASVTTVPGTTASFSAAGVSDSAIGVGGSLTSKVIFQWFKDGTAIPGATSPSYTTPLLTAGDVGTHQIVAGIRAFGIASFSNSIPAVLTVSADTVPPTIANAASFTLNGAKYLSIAFSERMDPSSLSNATYTVPGATVGGVSVNTKGGASVTLAITGTPTGPVAVSGVKDFSGNSIAAGASKAISALPLTSQDIGATGDPAYPSMIWVDGPNAFTVMAEGSDIWNNADGFNFTYEQKTGDFDVVVRQKSIKHTSNWSKGGLMVRETLDPGSRDWNIVNDPLSGDNIAAPDGSGLGANVVECNSRIDTDGASASWATGTLPNPAYPNAWVRLTRTGQVINGYASTDGQTWTLLGTQDPTKVGTAKTPLPATVYVGVAVTAHNNDAVGADPLLYYNIADFADYNSSFVPITRPTMALSKQGTAWKLTYTGTLQSSGTAGGTYSDVTGATSPYTVDTSTGAKFFRTRN